MEQSSFNEDRFFSLRDEVLDLEQELHNTHQELNYEASGKNKVENLSQVLKGCVREGNFSDLLNKSKKKMQEVLERQGEIKSRYSSSVQNLLNYLRENPLTIHLTGTHKPDYAVSKFNSINPCTAKVVNDFKHKIYLTTTPELETRIAETIGNVVGLAYWEISSGRDLDLEKEITTFRIRFGSTKRPDFYRGICNYVEPSKFPNLPDLGISYYRGNFYIVRDQRIYSDFSDDELVEIFQSFKDFDSKSDLINFDLGVMHEEDFCRKDS